MITDNKILRSVLRATGGNRVYVSEMAITVQVPHAAIQAECATGLTPGLYDVKTPGNGVLSLSRAGDATAPQAIEFYPYGSIWRRTAAQVKDLQRVVSAVTKERIYPGKRILKPLNRGEVVVLHHPVIDRVVIVGRRVSVVLFPPGSTTKMLVVGLPVAHHTALKERAATSVNRLILDLIAKEVSRGTTDSSK